MIRVLILALVLVLAGIPGPARAGQGLHYTYLWHLEQPIYWPAPDSSGLRYQRAWESLLAKQAGASHPENDLDSIFSKDDRVAAYQWRPKESLATLLSHPEAGVQVSYSGGLIENVQSLGGAGQLGYSGAWNAAFKEAQGWKTSQGTPRMDLVIFPFHHPLMPLTDERVLAMELALYQAAYPEVWDGSATSKGLFPPEMAFSQRIIPVLVKAGIDWVVVSNAHLSRACQNYPFVPGSGGDNIPPPNAADALNPPQDAWNSLFIDRGVSPTNAYPFAYRPHRARHVDPATGQAYSLVVVPAAQAESWKDGYSCYGLDAADQYAGTSEPDHPILVLMAHDGDNAFGGGFSYYMECVPNLAGTAAAKGWTPTSVAGYLQDHPVDPGDVVHVEDGAWVNADGDFGAPTFWNWNWPLSKDGQVDIANGWAEDQRNFAVIMAATNWVLTAEDSNGPADVEHVLHPEQGSSPLERAWHFLLGALNSGYMYYGKALDMELKPVVASNEAVKQAQAALGQTFTDGTGPTVFLPQHYPDNPGGINFGTLYGYKMVEMGPETWFWTFVHDVSGVAQVLFKYRIDNDGTNAMSTDDNDTYAGGPEVGPWTSLAMTLRPFPKGNPLNDPEIDTSILPDHIADEYWLVLDAPMDSLIDWYVEAADTQGNVTRSPIQHLFVGSAEGTTGPTKWSPPLPDCDDPVSVFTDKTGWLHWGVDGWTEPPEALWPPGTQSWDDGKAVETPLAPCDEGFCATLGPFGDTVSKVDFVFRHEDGTWDNNDGADYHIQVSPCVVLPDTADPGPPPEFTEPLDWPDEGAPDLAPADLGSTETGPPDPWLSDLPGVTDLPVVPDIIPWKDIPAGIDVEESSDPMLPAPSDSSCTAGPTGNLSAWLLLLLACALRLRRWTVDSRR